MGTDSGLVDEELVELVISHLETHYGCYRLPAVLLDCDWRAGRDHCLIPFELLP